ncbi:MAG: ATP-dependent Clp protease proteolytic subunit 1 [Luteibacter sp.]|uniref:head maturation protease, ClpP-related n=1 Tax=Luteibacter sp. TaxID=1886636 RepID=UPI00137D3B81|nr:head maturation protease, ClpP-related [Luteibacter sp.]KAF1005468.1 MAG: ATP-dependent Clp protease proteolytic subunit 1 [Luteibacter sp.]
MSLLQLPEIRADMSLAHLNFDLRPDAIQQWEPELQAAASDPATSISIYGPIGPSMDGSGVTDRSIAAALRSIGARDLTVNVNSPGGNYFQGVAIYNLLRQHQGKVTINVLGMAASAASLLTMAGDDILMGEGARLMIHNAWGAVIGNRHDLAKAITQMEPLDADMANAYAMRSGLPLERVTSLMDAETTFSASQAIGQGLATGHLQANRVQRGASGGGQRKAMAMVETALASAGLSRSERRETLRSLFSGTPSAAEPAMPCAGDDIAALLRTTLHTIRGTNA